MRRNEPCFVDQEKNINTVVDLYKKYIVKMSS